MHLITSTIQNVYTLTSHPQKDGCFVFKHQSKAEIAAANKSNTQFNSGIVIGQHTTSSKCPSNDKDLCAGFVYAKKYLTGGNGDPPIAAHNSTKAKGDPPTISANSNQSDPITCRRHNACVYTGAH